MRCTTALRCAFMTTGGALSTGMLVDADIANVVIAGPRIAPVDYALFAETPAQTWRWVGTDLLCVK